MSIKRHQIKLWIKNFRLIKLKYIIQGFYRRWFKKEKYAVTAELKKISCPQCWEAGYCIGGEDPTTGEFVEGCGCFAAELFYSDKKCIANRF